MSGPVRVGGSRRARPHTRALPHLYRGAGTKERELRKFEEEYGTEKGRYIYGATVGKVRLERLKKGKGGAK